MVAHQAILAPSVRPGDLVRGGVHLRYQGVAVVQAIGGLRADGFGHPPAEGVVTNSTLNRNFAIREWH